MGDKNPKAKLKMQAHKQHKADAARQQHEDLIQQKRQNAHWITNVLMITEVPFRAL